MGYAEAEMVELHGWSNVSAGPLTFDTLKVIQSELKPWQEHNFPGRPSWQPLLGVQEEVGELSHAFLKRAQNIRGSYEDHTADIEDAVADICIFLCDFCNAENIDLAAVLLDTWRDTVAKRDWRPEALA